MKKITLLLITYHLSLITTLAQNLVPNPSFEEYTVCPPGNSTSISYLPTGWIININSSDYFNICAPNYTQVSIPFNAWGYQIPYFGDAYCGFYGNTKNFAGYDAREFLGGELLSPLQPFKKYYISFELNLTSNYYCATNKIGILFTNFFFGDTIIVPPPLNDFAHVFTSEIITDTNKWVTVSGSFISDSAYRYFLIGNFFNGGNFDSIMYGNYPYCGTYYYIDNVCVSEDSLTCNQSVNISNLKDEQNINISQNENTISFELPIPNVISYNIYNELGIVINSGNNIYSRTIKINISDLKKGLYFAQIQYDNKKTIRKFIKL